MSIIPRAPERKMHGLAIQAGFRMCLVGDTSVTEATRPTFTFTNTNPPTHSEVNGSICVYIGATATEDIYWHREGGAWVKMAQLSDLLLPAVSDVTITAGGEATLTGAAHTIRGAGGLADICGTISGMTATEIAFLVTGAEAITYQDAAVFGAGGNISTSGNTSLVTATGDIVAAILSGTVVRVVPWVMTGGLPAGLNALARRAIIRGSATGLMEALDLAANQIPIGDGNDVVAATLPATGMVAKTGATSFSGRTLSVGPLASVSITNGDGVGGNPTIDAIQDIRTTASPTFQSLHLNGDLLVEGDSFLGELERIQLEANYIAQNLGYSANVAVTGGLVCNYFPTATTDNTIGAGVITAGVPATSDPTITTAGAATFSASDIVLISGASEDKNNGIFEVVSHAANLLTLRSTANGVTPRVEAFTDDQLIAHAGDVGITITKINVAVFRVGTDGRFEMAHGAITGLVFSDALQVSDFDVVPQDVTVTNPAGDLAINARRIVARGFGAAADDVITCSGLADGQSADVVCGAEAITFKDGATLSTERNADLVMAAGDIARVTRNGAVYFVKSVFCQAGVPTATGGTGATGTGNAAITTSPEWISVTYVNPPAPTNIIAQKNADFDETTWSNFTQPIVPMGVQIVTSADWDGGNIEITGLQAGPGDDGTETVTPQVGGGTVEATHGYIMLRRIRNLGTRTNGTVDVQVSPKLALLCGGRSPTLKEVYETSAHGRDAGATVSPTGLVTVTEAPDGAHDYLIIATMQNSASDSGHTHTGPSHSHNA